jgi:hypothetical protein
MILISEADHLIWVLRCERVIGGKQHSDDVVSTRWKNAINTRLTCNKIIATKIKCENKFTNLVINVERTAFVHVCLCLHAHTCVSPDLLDYIIYYPLSLDLHIWQFITLFRSYLVPYITHSFDSQTCACVTVQLFLLCSLVPERGNVR